MLSACAALCDGSLLLRLKNSGEICGRRAVFSVFSFPGPESPIVQMTAENPALSEPKSEPCPAPLAWQEIAQSFHESAESRIISIPNADLRVTEFGTGRPVVFLPGTSGSARLFCLTAWLLKEEYRSILIEFPRFHYRPAPAALVSQCAEAYSMAIEHLSPGGADLYASAFSSQVALEMMNAWPSVIRSLFLQGGWANRQFTRTEQAVLTVGRFIPLKLGRIPFWKSAQIENHRRWFPPFDETRFGFLLQEAAETPARDTALQLLAAARTDLRPRLQEIQQPVLVLHCEGEGRQIAAAEADLERLLPNVKQTEMYHSGHFPYLTHPHRLIKVLKPFWESLEQSTSSR